MIQPAKQQLDELFPLVYRELHRLARQHLSRERANHSLSPTALLHEAYIELSHSRSEWQITGIQNNTPLQQTLAEQIDLDATMHYYVVPVPGNIEYLRLFGFYSWWPAGMPQ